MDYKELLERVATRSFPIEQKRHLIGGTWITSGGELVKSHNPNDGKPLMTAPIDRSTVGQAIKESLETKEAIAQLPLEARLEILGRLRQSLADHEEVIVDILTLEAGKPRWEAARDFMAAIKHLDWAAKHGDHAVDSLLAPARLGRSTAKQNFALLPIGVTAAYLPFSTPLTSFVFYFSATVIAGCPLILCSSSHAMLTSLIIAKLSDALEFPRGLLNVLFGNFATFRQLVSERQVAAILYTGSREHCDGIRKEVKAHLGRQVVLQSGGKNAVIIDGSADLDLSVKCVVFGALQSAGQRCTSTSRVFVHADRANDFCDALDKAFKKVIVGRTDLPGSNPHMGPLYSDKGVAKYLRFQTMAQRDAAKTLNWGRALDLGCQGHFVTPALHQIATFDNTTAYQGNVLFAPDVAIYTYDDLGEAIGNINTTDAAFSVSFMGEAAELARHRHRFLAPNLFVNQPTVELDATLPLAGRLQSGHHRFHGQGIALYLCYPQVVDESNSDIFDDTKAMAIWQDFDRKI